MVRTKTWKREVGSIGKPTIPAVVASLFLISLLAVPLVGALPRRVPKDFNPENNKISGSWPGNVSEEVEIPGDATIEGEIQVGADVWITAKNATVKVTGGIGGGSVNVSAPGVTLNVEGGIGGGTVSLLTEGVELDVTGDVSGASVKVNGDVKISGSVKANADVEVSAEGAEADVGGNLDGGSIRATAPNATIDIANSLIGGNISVTEAAEVRAGKVAAGTDVEVDVEKSSLAGVNISVKNDVINLSISMDELGEKPLKLDVSPPGEEYKYLKIDAENMTENDISSATVDVKVEKAWLESAGISADAVGLYRYHDGEWQQLVAEETEVDNTYVYYSATTPGFSTFAITGAVTGEQEGISLALIAVVAIIAVFLSILATKKIILK